MAALFSIARNQIYSFFLVKYFDPENHKRRFVRVFTAGGSISRCGSRIRVRVPLRPAPEHSLRQSDRGFASTLPEHRSSLGIGCARQAAVPALLVVSLTLYAGCALLGLATHENMLYVAAPLMPMILSVVAAFYEAKETEHVRSFSQP